MNNSFFSVFKPKNNQFFEHLNKLSDAVLTTAELTLQCIKAEKREEIVSIFTQIKQQKHIGHKIQGKIFDELNKSFITPFDREDISNLAIYIKETVDYISSCAKRIILYSPKTMPDAAIILAMQVKDCATNLQLAVSGLYTLTKNPKQIAEYCDNLNVIEGKADEIYENFLIKLFQDEKDAIEIIKLKDILHELEHATDAADHVGKIIRTIIVKYA